MSVGKSVLKSVKEAAELAGMAGIRTDGQGNVHAAACRIMSMLG